MKIIAQGIAKKKINVIVSLLVLLFYQFSHFPLPKWGGGVGGRENLAF